MLHQYYINFIAFISYLSPRTALIIIISLLIRKQSSLYKLFSSLSRKLGLDNSIQTSSRPLRVKVGKAEHTLSPLSPSPLFLLNSLFSFGYWWNIMHLSTKQSSQKLSSGFLIPLAALLPHLITSIIWSFLLLLFFKSVQPSLSLCHML